MDDYTRAVLRARRLHLVLDAITQRELLALLERHADALARAVANLPEDAPAHQVARMVRDLYERLEGRLLRVTESSIRTQATAIKAEMDAAAYQAIRAEGWRGSFVPTPAATVAQAFMARQGTAQSFRTLRQDVRGAAAGVDSIISEALLAQMSPEELSRRLRPYVLGSEAFTNDELRDLRKVPKAKRDAARQLRHNADRIAITEMGNAAHEAQTVAMIEAPQVTGWRWRLSPVRGTQQDRPDECNVLAEQDLYGLGKGIYPVERVPTRPHPNCRCVAPWTRVLTEHGWRRIDAVRPGDRVWTHRGRWRRVAALVVGDVTGGWRTMRAGRRALAVTEDHPILTPAGWVDAGDLRGGSRVVALPDDRDRVRAESIGVGAQLLAAPLPVEHQQFPAERGEQFGLPGVLGTLLRGPVPAAVNFDGELRGRYGNVDVENVQRPQSLGRYPRGAQSVEDGTFVFRQALARVNGPGGEAAAVGRMWDFREDTAAVLREARPFFGGGALVPDQVGLGYAPAGNAHLLEPVLYGPAVDPEALGDLLFGDPFVHVQAPDFVHVEVDSHSRIRSSIRRYCLVVVEDSSFVAEGIVVHNCWGQSVTRPMAEWGRAKPEPSILRRPSAAGLEGLSPAARRRAVAEAREAIANGVVADRERRSERRRVA